MKKRKLSFTIIGLAILSLILVVWLNGVLTEEFFASRILNQRTDASDLATAFSFALRLNHPSAYEMTAPSLWSRLDVWMKTHQVRKCEWRGLMGEYITIGADDNNFFHNFFCNYSFNVTDIVIQNSQVVDWGEAGVSRRS